ncbi:MAG TPA: hypothetical protein VIA63_05575 [Candidatus Limnocylindria bacterium]|jgi:hypothetical protein
MFNALWSTLFGLLVDDGQLAIGALAAMGIALALAYAGGERLQDVVGWILLVLVLALVIANLYRAGRLARARVSSARR